MAHKVKGLPLFDVRGSHGLFSGELAKTSELSQFVKVKLFWETHQKPKGCPFLNINERS
jgi:hypothetical protein